MIPELPPPGPPVLLTIPEVARLLRLSPQTIRAWIHQGRLVAYRPGGRRFRVEVAAVRALLDQGRVS